MHIVFVHGWGLAPDFWEELAAHFPEAGRSFIDLGFIGTGQDTSEARDGIYITHSLGTPWTLKNCTVNIRRLVAVNGFSSFRRFASKDEIMKMKENLRANPAGHMEHFWNGIHVKAPQGRLNISGLEEGLDWLAQSDGRAELKALNCPVLSLAGEEDKILPLGQMRKEWAGCDLRICEGGGHALPQTHAQWCAMQIRGFMN